MHRMVHRTHNRKHNSEISINYEKNLFISFANVTQNMVHFGMCIKMKSNNSMGGEILNRSGADASYRVTTPSTD